MSNSLDMSNVKRWVNDEGQKIVYVAEQATGNIIWQPVGKWYRDIKYYGWEYKGRIADQAVMRANCTYIDLPITSTLNSIEILFYIPDVSKYTDTSTNFKYPIIGWIYSASSQRRSVCIYLSKASSNGSIWGVKVGYNNNPNSTSNTWSAQTLANNINSSDFGPNNLYKLTITKNSTACNITLENVTTITTIGTRNNWGYFPNISNDIKALWIGACPAYSSGSISITYQPSSSSYTIFPMSIGVQSVAMKDSSDQALYLLWALEDKEAYMIQFSDINTGHAVGSYGVLGNGNYIITPENMPYPGTTDENPKWCLDEFVLKANISDI